MNLEANSMADLTGLLGKVTVPVLGMRGRDDGSVVFDAGRRMAAGVPGASFVPLACRNHQILAGKLAY